METFSCFFAIYLAPKKLFLIKTFGSCFRQCLIYCWCKKKVNTNINLKNFKIIHQMRNVISLKGERIKKKLGTQTKLREHEKKIPTLLID